MNEMDEIVHEFLVESHENLDQLDQDLVALEQEPDSRPLLGSVFRTIHTIKGTSGFLAFGQLEKLTHVGEGLLSHLRDGRMVLTPEITSVLLELVDAVRTILRNVEADGTEGDVNIGKLLARLTALQNGESLPPEGPPSVDVNPDGSPLFGQSLVDKGVVSEEDVTLAVMEQSVGDQRLIGEILVEHGAVTPEDLSQVLGMGADGRRSVADSSVRVDVEVLDNLMRLVGEMVLTRNQIAAKVLANSDVSVTRNWQRLNVISSDLQLGVMKARMQPIESVWSKLPRIVRDLSVFVGKHVRLEMFGADTELDRSVIEAIKDPLTHLVRNALDHGIESPEVRVALGKPAEGRLTLRAYHDGGQVNLEISDDGAGIDSTEIGAKAVERGLIKVDQLAAMSERDIINLIFLAGFSTAEAVTNISGRGVGMDVVKSNMERIAGSVEIMSEPGSGTTFRIKIPLTLAIVSAIVVACADSRLAIPQASLLEIVRLEGDERVNRIERISGAPVFRLRDNLLPLVSVREALGYPPAELDDRSWFIAVLGNKDRQYGLLVDQVVDTEEIVVRPLSAHLKAIQEFSGVTMLADGRLAMIIDVWGLAAASNVSLTSGGRNAMRGDDQEEEEAGRSLLVVRLGEGRRLAIPMDQVTRLEEIPLAKLEKVGEREALQYRDGILPIARLDAVLTGVPHARELNETLQVVVYTEGGRSVGLVVEEILDIAVQGDGGVMIETDIDGPGVTGTTVVQERVMEMLDVRQAILAADPHFYATAGSTS
ncbi:MAG: two-component system, chemotaxis family, sensor kinase CheA [Frankiales bacterium]|nr:two-component system, chemotaxis family, sensor kinase CheA [Frankiales bacterium]